MSKRSNIKNLHFGRLVALHPTKSDKNGHMYWLCKCGDVGFGIRCDETLDEINIKLKSHVCGDFEKKECEQLSLF